MASHHNHGVFPSLVTESTRCYVGATVNTLLLTCQAHSWRWVNLLDAYSAIRSKLTLAYIHFFTILTAICGCIDTPKNLQTLFICRCWLIRGELKKSKVLGRQTFNHINPFNTPKITEFDVKWLFYDDKRSLPRSRLPKPNTNSDDGDPMSSHNGLYTCITRRHWQPSCKSILHDIFYALACESVYICQQDKT